MKVILVLNAAGSQGFIRVILVGFALSLLLAGHAVSEPISPEDSFAISHDDVYWSYVKSDEKKRIPAGRDYTESNHGQQIAKAHSQERGASTERISVASNLTDRKDIGCTLATAIVTDGQQSSRQAPENISRDNMAYDAGQLPPYRDIGCDLASALTTAVLMEPESSHQRTPEVTPQSGALCVVSDLSEGKDIASALAKVAVVVKSEHTLAEPSLQQEQSYQQVQDADRADTIYAVSDLPIDHDVTCPLVAVNATQSETVQHSLSIIEEAVQPAPIPNIVSAPSHCPELLRYDLPLSHTLLQELTVDTRATITSKAQENEERYLVAIGDLPKPEKGQELANYDEGAISIATGCARFDSIHGYYWIAPSFYHRPLYFEQPGVERYGHYIHGDCVQSAISTAHFFGSAALLPYKMGAEPYQCCDYTLGRYRPGSCNPRHITYGPLSKRGLFYQGLVVTGGVFLIP